MKFQDNLSLGGKVVTAISSQSRSTPTYAQAKLAEDILLVLQRRRGFDNPWIDHIWDLPDKAPWPEDIALLATPSTSASPFENLQYPINSSQNDAIISMLSTAPEDKITIIQGPPGYVLTISATPHLVYAQINFNLSLGLERPLSSQPMSCLLLKQGRRVFG